MQKSPAYRSGMSPFAPFRGLLRPSFCGRPDFLDSFFQKFSEVGIAPVLFGRASYVQTEVLCGPTYIRPMIPLGRIMAPLRVGPPDRGDRLDELSP